MKRGGGSRCRHREGLYLPEQNSSSDQTDQKYSFYRGGQEKEVDRNRDSEKAAFGTRKEGEKIKVEEYVTEAG